MFPRKRSFLAFHGTVMMQQLGCKFLIIIIGIHFVVHTFFALFKAKGCDEIQVQCNSCVPSQQGRERVILCFLTATL